MLVRAEEKGKEDETWQDCDLKVERHTPMSQLCTCRSQALPICHIFLISPLGVNLNCTLLVLPPLSILNLCIRLSTNGPQHLHTFYTPLLGAYTVDKVKTNNSQSPNSTRPPRRSFCAYLSSVCVLYPCSPGFSLSRENISYRRLWTRSKFQKLQFI